MNKRALHIKKYITTILLLVFFFPMQKTTAQKTPKNDAIQLIVGSYKYELNALILKRKLVKKGFKQARILKKTNGLYRVSINQLTSLEEVDRFIESNKINKDQYWLLYSNKFIGKPTSKKQKTKALTSKGPSKKIVKDTLVKTNFVVPETPKAVSQKKKDTLLKAAKQNLPIVKIPKPVSSIKSEQVNATIS